MPGGAREPGETEAILAAGGRALGLDLDAGTLDAFRRYLEEILRWSNQLNLTALSTPEAIVREGFLDSLICASLVPADARQALDIGSGAGFPAVPLALVCPALAITLVEANRRRASFLRHVVRTLGLTRLRVDHARIEPGSPSSHPTGGLDLILARAVAPSLAMGALVFPLLRPGGIFLAQLGPETGRPEVLEGLRRLGFEMAGEACPPPSFRKTGHRVVALRHP
jgi:16S rRNA (guanine527-N7)-methyltransferase